MIKSLKYKLKSSINYLILKKIKNTSNVNIYKIIRNAKIMIKISTTMINSGKLFLSIKYHINEYKNLTNI
jgi:hypothetical protein